MNDPTPIKTQAAAVEAKAQNWLQRNWYAFSIGAGSCLVVVKLAHLVGLLKVV